MSERDFEGKSAIVTGGTRGIGKAVALALASRGANVLINYRDSSAAANDVISEIEKHRVKGVACQADLADPGASLLIVNRAVEAFGRLDILVNNAGISHLQRLGEAGDWAEADRLWAINTLGVVATIRAAAEVMADEGRIITMGSVSGTRAGMAGAADYCGSKAAIAGYTRGAAHDLAPRKITVNVVESGMMNTDMAHGMPEADKARIMAAIPLARFGDLEEIAALICFLASPAAAYITGATLTIDGGVSA
jgi:3-oxoacyl-[acyl-carrier protein] reductase